MDGWSEEEVQEWITLIGLTAEETEVVQKAMAEDDADGEDLKAMTAAFDSGSGTAKPLQKLLKRAGAEEPASLAKQAMQLHEAALGEAPAEGKLTAAQDALTAARKALRDNLSLIHI